MTQVIQEFAELSDLYQGFLFDAYGVLVDDCKAIPGAKEVWQRLRQQGKSLWILTNGSSKTLAESAASYRAKGLQVEESQIINSASLLLGYFKEKNLQGRQTAVLGTRGSASYVREAGGELVDATCEEFEVLVVANQTDYPFVETLDRVISHILSRLDRGDGCDLILTNPDFIYPKDRGT